MTVHSVSPERTPIQHHICAGGTKPNTVVVIDKSSSLPPTLEHHLAIHLWMGWIGLYVLSATTVVVGIILLSLFRLSGGFISQILVSSSEVDCRSIAATFPIRNSTRYPTYSSEGPTYGTYNIFTRTVPATAPIMSDSHISSSSLIILAMYIVELSTAIWCLLVFFAVLISAIAPLNKHGSPNPKWCLSIGNWIMRMGSEYFKLKVVLEDYDAMRLSAETGKPAIFVLEPHDVLPVSIFSLCDFLGALPGKRRLIGCISSACFKVPLMRHVWSWVCAESIDRKNVVRLLKEGVSVCLCPGGVREVIEMSIQQEQRSKRQRLHNSKGLKRNTTHTKAAIIPLEGESEEVLSKGKGRINDMKKSSITLKDAEAEVEVEEEVFEDECVLYLRARKGFVRLALQHGCPLVPMFTFGQRAVLEPWFCTNSWICYLGRQMGFVPMVFFGQWGLPFGVPKSRPLTVVVGSPVEVPQRIRQHVVTTTPTTPSTSTSTSTSSSTSTSTSTSTTRSRHTIPTQQRVESEKESVSDVHMYEPSDAEVEGYLETFIMALEKLYEDNCKLYGMGHVKLVIM